MTDEQKKSLALVTVRFYEDDLVAGKDASGVWVPVKRVCEALGITEQRQSEKLKGKAWAVTTMRVATMPIRLRDNPAPTPQWHCNRYDVDGDACWASARSSTAASNTIGTSTWVRGPSTQKPGQSFPKAIFPRSWSLLGCPQQHGGSA